MTSGAPLMVHVQTELWKYDTVIFELEMPDEKEAHNNNYSNSTLHCPVIEHMHKSGGSLGSLLLTQTMLLV